jgi:hypothetical protein
MAAFQNGASISSVIDQALHFRSRMPLCLFCTLAENHHFVAHCRKFWQLRS